jgi:small subunit ribosomal protein S2
VIALVDTNCDPDEVTYVVPGNDDAIRSCSLVIKAIADGIAAAKTKVTEAELTAAAAAAPVEGAAETAPAADAGEAPAAADDAAPAADTTESAETAGEAAEPVGAEKGAQP